MPHRVPDEVKFQQNLGIFTLRSVTKLLILQLEPPPFAGVYLETDGSMYLLLENTRSGSRHSKRLPTVSKQLGHVKIIRYSWKGGTETYTNDGSRRVS